MDPVTMLVAALVWQGGRFPQQGGGGGGAEEAALAVVQIVVQLLFTIPTIAGMWGVFSKAGKPGWAAIIPIYNIIVLLEVADKPVWWVILFCCPIVNIVIHIIVVIEVAQKFGQGRASGSACSACRSSSGPSWASARDTWAGAGRVAVAVGVRGRRRGRRLAPTPPLR
jgi:hypothetical protein